jgi:hypothetical protein
MLELKYAYFKHPARPIEAIAVNIFLFRKDISELFLHAVTWSTLRGLLERGKHIETQPHRN